MKKSQAYPTVHHDPVISIIKSVDHDVERSEDMIMLGYMLVLAAPMFAPITPPHILLPMMALALILTVCVARRHFLAIQAKLKLSMQDWPNYQSNRLSPLLNIFNEHPKHTLTQAFNPLKNLKRTFNSTVGGILINPFWTPILYALCMQFAEEKHVHLLNRAILLLEKQNGMNQS